MGSETIQIQYNTKISKAQLWSSLFARIYSFSLHIMILSPDIQLQGNKQELLIASLPKKKKWPGKHYQDSHYVNINKH